MFSELSSHVDVFLSHKHTDKKELVAVKIILEDCGANPYVDWLDSTMPKETRTDTAIKIKKKIKDCEKFIFIATNDALQAPWCSWEIGYCDAQKLSTDSIALFSIADNNVEWKGNEYLQLYPSVEYEDGTTHYQNGSIIPKGFYVEYLESNRSRSLIPLNNGFYKNKRQWQKNL